MATVSIGTITFDIATRYFTLQAVLTNFGGASASGVFRILAPDGTYYYSPNNSLTTFNTPSSATYPDITLVNNSSSNIIGIPLGVLGEPQVGTYRFELNVSGFDVSAPTTPILVSATPYFYDYSFKKPTAIISGLADNYSSLLTVVDNTTYTVNEVNPSITKSIEIVFPTGILDAGNVAPSLLPDYANELADRTYTTTNSSTAISPSYVGTWLISLDATLIYSFLSGKVLIRTVISDSKTIVLEQTIDLVKQWAGMANLWNNYFAYENKNLERERHYFTKIDRANRYYIAETAAINGGDLNSASKFSLKLNEELELNLIDQVSGTQILPINTSIGNPILLNQSI